MDLFPLYNSLRITVIAVSIAFVIGIFAAYAVLRMPRIFKGICDTIFSIPLVLPPTVVGYFILVCLSPNSMFGQWFDIKILMRWQAAVIAVAIIAFPFIYRMARGAFESFDQNLLDAGRTLGLSEKYIFFRILIPNCKHGIIAGTVIAFARGLGEYGATSMVCGYIAGRTATVSTSVAYFWQINKGDMAFYWVMINIAIAFVFIFLIELFNKQKIRV